SRRWAERLHDELLGRSTGNLAGPVFAVPGGGIYPAAHPVYEQLRVADSLHRFVDHVRSSQAFAINLFGGLDDARQALLWWALTGADVSPTGLELEWIDPLDALAESQPTRPHQTQIDVMLRAIDSTGARLAALVEVK